MTKEFVGYRMRRHLEHMARVRAVQRRGQYDRVQATLAKHLAWKSQGILGATGEETLALLVDMRDDLAQRMRDEGQEP
jgi:hypothetical protein